MESVKRGPKPPSVQPGSPGGEEPYAQAQRLRAEQNAESSQRALERYKEAAELFLSEGELSKAAGALRNAGEIYQLLGDTTNALSTYTESLNLSLKSKDSLEECRTRNALGYLYFIAGNSKATREQCSLALQLARAKGDRELEAQAISNIAESYYGAGDLTRALTLQKEALERWGSLGNPRGQAQASVALGYYYSHLSEPLKALDCLQRALRLSHEAGDLRLEGLANIAIGNLKSKLGDSQEALDAFFAGRQLVEQVGARVELATALGGIGVIYYRLGDQQLALDYLQRALKLFESMGEAWGTAEVSMDLGRVHHSMGSSREALDAFERALALFRSLSMPRLEAQTLRDVGLVYKSIKDPERALDSYRQALRLTKLGQDQRQEAYTLDYIGNVYEDLKQYDNALVYYRQALPLNRIAIDPAGEALTLSDIAHSEMKRGNLAEAHRQIEAATTIAETLRAKVSSQDLRASYFATVRQIYELNIDILMQRHKAAPDEGFASAAFGISEKARARSFLESLHEAQVGIRAGVDQTLLDKQSSIEAMLNAKGERQVQLLANKDKEGADKLEKEIDLLTTEYAEIHNQIKASSPRYAALTAPQPLGLAETQQQILDPDSVLLEYALGDERSYVWMITHDTVSAFELAPRAEIESSARRLYDLFTDYQMVAGELQDKRVERQTRVAEKMPQEAALLSHLILGPLAGQLGKKRLLIVADGALLYIPFQSLIDPDSNPNSPKFLVENHEIVNEPSASTLALLLNEARGRKPPSNTIAVLADPVFEIDDPRIKRSTDRANSDSAETQKLRQALRDIGISGDGVQIPRLLASREEADAIMASAPWGTGLKATGFSANRERVVGDELSAYRIVHFATHGLINNKHPELSGIVLSLFDSQGRAQDGFLRLHDIYNLHLPVDLIVLSACSTGLGKDVKGEGLVGLTRGFMYAGASGVVASLWKVDDDATAALMKYFYEGMFQEGLTPAAALRQAQMKLSRQKSWQSPYYWAGFIIEGQYNQRENSGRRFFSSRQGIAVAGTFVGSLLVLGFFALRRRRRRII